MRSLSHLRWKNCSNSISPWEIESARPVIGDCCCGNLVGEITLLLRYAWKRALLPESDLQVIHGQCIYQEAPLLLTEKKHSAGSESRKGEAGRKVFIFKV